MKHFLYIAQASKETTTCKIGITDNLDLNENSPTKVLLATQQNAENSPRLHSKSNGWEYLFTCEVKNAEQIEKDIRNEPGHLRENRKLEVYLCNDELLEKYINFIKSHKLFIQEIFINKKEEPTQETIIVKKTTPSLEERGLSHKDVLERAKRVKNDEFYTRYEDVEKELSMYDKKIWKNKTILCNCDDALEPGNRNNTSAFSQYFVDNFKQLKIKKLICIHYSGNVDLFNQGKKAYVYIRVYTGDNWHDRKDCPKDYDGSFDHPLSLKILNEETDIVCTNPPFSRMKEYWKTVIDSGKKFLIISNFTNVKNQPYISYLINKLVWPGYNEVYWYRNPKWELTRAAGHWYTNLPIKDRPKHNLIKIISLKKNTRKIQKIWWRQSVISRSQLYSTKLQKAVCGFSVSNIKWFAGKRLRICARKRICAVHKWQAHVWKSACAKSITYFVLRRTFVCGYVLLSSWKISH